MANYLGTKEDNLYMTNQSPIERGAITPILNDIKNSMNSKRTKFRISSQVVRHSSFSATIAGSNPV